MGRYQIGAVRFCFLLLEPESGVCTLGKESHSLAVVLYQKRMKYVDHQIVSKTNITSEIASQSSGRCMKISHE